MSSLPDHPERMSPDWLAAQLGAEKGALRGFSSKEVGDGQMCQSFRLQLDWAQPRADLPASIVAKCPHYEARTRETAKTYHAYELETQWYQHHAAQCPARVPHCYCVQLAENGLDFVLLLEDLTPAYQKDQPGGASEEEVLQMLAEAARLHAFAWQQPWLAADWLNRRDPQQEMIVALLPDLYEQWAERYRTRLGADILEAAKAMAHRYGRITASQKTFPSLAHTDLRLDNVLFMKQERRAALLDWQSVQRGPHMGDVAYCIATSFVDAEERARREDELVRTYYAQLCAAGVTDYDWTQCWDAYRLHAGVGVIMSIVAGVGVELTEQGYEIIAVLGERSAQQMMHLETLSLF